MSFCLLGADGSLPAGINTRLQFPATSALGEMYSWHADLGLPKMTFSQNCLLLTAQPQSLLVSIKWDLLALSFPRAMWWCCKVMPTLREGVTLTLQKAKNARQAPTSMGKVGQVDEDLAEDAVPASPHYPLMKARKAKPRCALYRLQNIP